MDSNLVNLIGVNIACHDLVQFSRDFRTYVEFEESGKPFL